MMPPASSLHETCVQVLYHSGRPGRALRQEIHDVLVFRDGIVAFNRNDMGIGRDGAVFLLEVPAEDKAGSAHAASAGEFLGHTACYWRGVVEQQNSVIAE